MPAEPGRPAGPDPAAEPDTVLEADRPAEEYGAADLHTAVDLGPAVDQSLAVDQVLAADLRRAADLILARPPRLGRVRLVAVDGPSGSGKTVFATALVELLRAGGHRVELFSTDLLATWTDPFGWWDRFRADVLVPLERGRAGAVIVNDWANGQPVAGPMVRVDPVEMVIVEGVSSGRTAAAELLSVLIWVEVAGAQVRLERAVTRDGEVDRAELMAWQRAEGRHFTAEATVSRADLHVNPR